MENIVFYQPPTALRNQRLPFPGAVTVPSLRRESIASSPARQITTAVDSRSGETQTSGLHYRTEKHDSTDSRNPSNHDDGGDHSDDDYFPDLNELFSRTQQKSLPIGADLSGDDYSGFIEIDELPSDLEQKGAPSTDPDSGGTVDEAGGNGTRSGSPVGSSRSTPGSSRDPIILGDSEDESAGAESETDYGNLDTDLADKSDSSYPHIADRDMADGEGFGSGTTYISGHLVDDNDNGVVDGEGLQLAAELPMSANPDRDSVTVQVCRVRASTKVIEESRSLQDLEVTKEAAGKEIDVFVNTEADADTCSVRISESPVVSYDNPASDSNVALSELQGSRHGVTQSPESDSAVASLEQSDSNNDIRAKPRRRADSKNLRHKRLHMQAATRPAGCASPVSAALESGDECAQSTAHLVAPSKEREICDTDQEMADVGGTDDSNDEDYSDTSDASASKIRGSRSRKRVRRARGQPNSVETPSIHSLNVSSQDCTAAATSSVSMQKSEEVPIRGFLTLKTVGSNVLYTLTFSQEPLPELGGILRAQGIPGTVSEPLPLQELPASGPVKPRFTIQEDELLLQLKGKGLSWLEISDHFPERSKGTLQVRYSTKLKPRPEKSNNTRKHRRSG